MNTCDNIAQTIDHTPLVTLHRVCPGPAKVLAKLEFFNPASSVKDRPALAIIDAAEASGALLPGELHHHIGAQLAFMFARLWTGVEIHPGANVLVAVPVAPGAVIVGVPSTVQKLT